MKIIASIDSGRFLVEATSDELAQVMGYGSAYSLKDNAKPVIGSTIRVNKLYEALSVERGRREAVAQLADALRKQADKIDTINAALSMPLIVEGQS